MSELKVMLPKLLESDAKRIEREVESFISSEEKSKRLSLFIDNLMSSAKQLSSKELVELGRQVKKGRYNSLKKEGFL